MHKDLIHVPYVQRVVTVVEIKGRMLEITGRILTLPAGNNEKLLTQKQYFIRFCKTEISITFQKA